MRKRKSDIAQLRMTSEEIRLLREKGINSIDDLWSSIGVDFDEGINKLASRAHVRRVRLLALLSARGVSEAGKADTPWLVRYWFEMLLVLVSVVFLVDVGYALVLAL